MSNGANDWRDCTNCHYAIWEKDEVLACHRRAPQADQEDRAVFPEVDDTTFCYEYRARWLWRNFLWWIEWTWRGWTYERRRRAWIKGTDG